MLLDMAKDEAQEAYERALDDGWKQTAIAKAIGVPVESLRQFKTNGALGRQYRAALIEWLEQKDYLENPEKSDPSVILARELRVLADVIESPEIEKEVKGKRFVAFLDAYAAGYRRYLALDEEGKNDAR